MHGELWKKGSKKLNLFTQSYREKLSLILSLQVHYRSHGAKILIFIGIYTLTLNISIKQK